MIKLTLITGNPGKIKEFKTWLSLPDWVEIDHRDLNPPEIQALSLKEVAQHKAYEVYKQLKTPFIVEDSGIFFTAYNNFPGVFSKYAFQQLGYKGLLYLTKENPEAYFKSIIAYMDETCSEPQLFSGEVKGVITQEVDDQAHLGFPYDNIFIPSEHTKTNSRLSFEEMRDINHRGRAIQKFNSFFAEYAKKFK